MRATNPGTPLIDHAVPGTGTPAARCSCRRRRLDGVVGAAEEESMAVAGRNRSIPDIFSDIVHQLTRLFRSEVELARAEMSEKVGQIGLGLSLIIGGAVLLIPALVILLQAAMTALQEAEIADELGSALIVGGVVLLLGLILLMVGISRLKARHLVPEKTISQLQRDAAVATHQMRSDHAATDRAA
jgi:hypothetical protein